MKEEQLVPVFVPSLAALLHKFETEKGTALTRDEVIATRDGATVVMMPPAGTRELARTRGYEDVDPERCWGDWQRLRFTLAAVEMPDDPVQLLNTGRSVRIPAASGVEIACGDDGRVKTIWLTAGELGSRMKPNGLTLLGLKRDEASRQLGTPTKTRPGWDRFDRDKVGVHLEYVGGIVTRVTLMWLPSMPSHLL